MRDPVLRWNDGRLRLEVAGGRGRVTPVAGDDDATPDLALDVRTLATLYTGYLTPDALHAAGTLAAFAGPPPWMADDF